MWYNSIYCKISLQYFTVPVIGGKKRMEKVEFINSSIPLWAGKSEERPTLNPNGVYTVVEEYDVGFHKLFRLAGFPGYFNSQAFKLLHA